MRAFINGRMLPPATGYETDHMAAVSNIVNRIDLSHLDNERKQVDIPETDLKHEAPWYPFYQTRSYKLGPIKKVTWIVGLYIPTSLASTFW